MRHRVVRGMQSLFRRTRSSSPQDSRGESPVRISRSSSHPNLLADRTPPEDEAPAEPPGIPVFRRRPIGGDAGRHSRSFSDCDQLLSTAAGLDDPQLVSPTRGKVVKSLRMTMREARRQELEEALAREAEDARADAAEEEALHTPVCAPNDVGSISLTVWERLGKTKPTTGTEIRNMMFAEALTIKREFSKHELAAFKLSDLRCSSYILVGDSYFRPTTGSGPRLARQQRDLKALAGCPSPKLPGPALMALVRTAQSPTQSLGFRRTTSADGTVVVVNFSRKASFAAKVRRLPPVDANFACERLNI